MSHLHCTGAACPLPLTLTFTVPQKLTDSAVKHEMVQEVQAMAEAVMGYAKDKGIAADSTMDAGILESSRESISEA